jgi:hypothetical protein
MKPLKLNKKLSLNKRTIVNLNNHEMKNAYGGVSGPDTTCLSFFIETKPAPTCETCETCVTCQTCVTCVPTCQSGDTTILPELCCKAP